MGVLVLGRLMGMVMRMEQAPRQALVRVDMVLLIVAVRMDMDRFHVHVTMQIGRAHV